MKIVQVVPDFGLGGIQKGGIVLDAALAALGNECHVIGRAAGPRYATAVSPNHHHHLLKTGSEDEFLQLLREIDPEVIHLHRRAYPESLIRRLSATGNRLIVTTPVFGRPPDDPIILRLSRTCHVGVYTFYRFVRWTRTTARDAVANGLGYVPITPFQPPVKSYSSLDPAEQLRERRRSLNVPDDSFVVGRIGRQHVSKWHAQNPSLVDRLLSADPRVVWLSIGFPLEYQPGELSRRWPGRFINLPETADHDLLARVLSSLDAQIMFGRGECFASTICEAAGMGVPTLALATPLFDNGQAEQVVDDETGYLVGSVDQAVSRTMSMLSSPAQLRRMNSAPGNSP